MKFYNVLKKKLVKDKEIKEKDNKFAPEFDSTYIKKIITEYSKNIILFLIKLYQKTLSFDHGPLKILKPYGTCKFRPTCSEYTYQAIEKYGILKGAKLGLNRLRRCHPWSKGGWEPLE